MQSKIQPGLQRTRRLLGNFQQRWSAVHVAGTNGKGSVCAYITAMLRRAHLRTGRFASPHLIDRWDGITVNDRIVDKQTFQDTEAKIKALNDRQDIGASPFEILTATAFHIFNQENVDLAVIECGLGGREDATNVVQNPLVTVITQLGLDHQEFLGNTIEEVAYQKAGIIKSHAVCVIPPKFSKSVIRVIRNEAYNHNSHVSVQMASRSSPVRVGKLPSSMLATHSLANMSVASKAVECSWPKLAALGHEYFKQVSLPQQIRDDLGPAMFEVQLPGRLQTLSIECLTNRKNPVLIDGAHNSDAWRALARYVDDQLRSGKPTAGEEQTSQSPVTWVLSQSASAHKSPAEMIERLCKPGDRIFVVGFGAVDGMPWLKPAAFHLYSVPESWNVQQPATELHLCEEGSLLDTLSRACAEAKEGPVVIAGSLYLISDVMKLLRDAGHDPRDLNK